jgi:hypothetical protein
MTDVDPNLQALANYAAPEYWDGLQIGVDAAEYNPARINIRKSTPLARAAIKSYFATSTEYQPVRQYNLGEPFDANQYNDGTIVTILMERLSVTSIAELPSPNDVPPRVIEIDPRIHSTDNAGLFYVTEQARYDRNVRWGSVVRDKLGKAGLLHISAFTIVPNPGAEPHIVSLLMPHSGTFDIGKVYSTRPDTEGAYIRINRLEVVGNGVVSKSRETAKTKRGFSLFGLRAHPKTT